MKKLILLATSLMIAASVSGCGKMADLEAPPARETERAQRDRWAPSLPDPATINRPSTQQPIDGGPVNPMGAPAAGRDPQ